MFESFLKGIFYILYSIVLLIITPIRNYIYNPIVNRLDLIGGNRDNGIITIKPEKITYKHGDTEEIEIESQDREKEGHRSIQLPREIIQTLFDGDEMGDLSFKYLAKEKVFMQSNNDIEGGVLLTGKLANFKIGEDFCAWISKNRNNLNINSLPIRPVININSNFNQRNSVFAAIGVETNDALIENHGSMNIRTDYILFIANKIYSGNGGATLLENGFSSDISDLDAIFVIITDNLIYSANYAFLINNFNLRRIRIGKNEAKIVKISNNNVRGIMNAKLIGGSANLEVNGEYIYITDNNISSTGPEAYLLKNSWETTIGAPNTRIVNISNNRVIGEYITSLIGVDSESVLTVNGNFIYVMANSAHCILENRGKVNINLYGANSRFELFGNEILENNEGQWKDITMFGGSQLNFINNFGTRATIVIEDNICSDGDNTILTFEGVESNEKNFAKTKRNLGLDKSSVSVGGEENTFLRIPIAIGSGIGGTFLIQNPDIQTNNNDNYTFGDTNNNNNNENEENNEYENDLFFVKLKKIIKVSKIEIKANTTISMEDGGKFERVKRGSTLNIPEGKRLIVRSDGSCNSIRDCISGFTMSDETMSRIRFYRQEMDYDED